MPRRPPESGTHSSMSSPASTAAIGPLEGQAVTAFQLDPDGEIVAAPCPATTTPACQARFFGAQTDQLAAAPDEIVGRNAQVMDRRVIGVPGGVRRLVNNCSTPGPPKRSGGRLMACTDDQGRQFTGRPLIAVRHRLRRKGDFSWAWLLATWRDGQNKTGKTNHRFPVHPGAAEESRTLDLNLGKVALYQLSYCRVQTSQTGGASRSRTDLHGFAIRCITALLSRRASYRTKSKPLSQILERQKSLELSTSTLARLRSTN